MFQLTGAQGSREREREKGREGGRKKRKRRESEKGVRKKKDMEISLTSDIKFAHLPLIHAKRG